MKQTGIIPLNLKIYLKSITIKTARDWQKTRHRPRKQNGDSERLPTNSEEAKQRKSRLQ